MPPVRFVVEKEMGRPCGLDGVLCVPGVMIKEIVQWVQSGARLLVFVLALLSTCGNGQCIQAV